jgi:salicylate 5-hydroxylase large subunit
MPDHHLPQWPGEGLTRIPHAVYTDEAIYEREQERIFRGAAWNYVGLEAEVPNPGDFVKSFVAETPVIVTRDAGGGVNVLVNRCPHKGVQFCQEAAGNTRTFACPYHQWSFDLKGSLQGLPFRRGVDGQGGFSPEFDFATHGLDRLHVTTHRGAIFASFSAETAPFASYLGDSNLGYFERVFDGRRLRVLGKMKQRVATNWKTLVENFKDPYHATLLHVFFATFGIWRAGQRTEVRIDPTGGSSTLVQTSPVVLEKKRADEIEADIAAQMKVFKKDFMALADPTILRVLREFPEDEDTVTMQTLWPNCAIHQNLNSLGVRLALPRGPNAIEIHWTFFGYEGDSPEITERRLLHANFFGPGGLVTGDDIEVWQLNQRGVRTTPPGVCRVEAGGSSTADADFVITESAVRAFYKHYRRVMGF